MIRLLIAHRTRLNCELLAAVLRDEPDIYVAGYAHTYEDALAGIREHKCNAVLAHIGLPNHDALRLARTLRETGAEVNVLVTGLLDSSAAILRCAEEGAAGYVLETDTLADLVKKLRAVHDGKSLVSSSVAFALLQRVAQLKQLTKELNAINLYQVDELFAQLTPREWEVLHLITLGYTNQQIADELVIEKGTTKNHVHNILSKLDVHSREQAALLARHMLGDQYDKMPVPAEISKHAPSFFSPSTAKAHGNGSGNGQRYMALTLRS